MADLRFWQELITRVIEISGIAAIVVGGAIASAHFGLSWWAVSLDAAYRAYRQNLGRAILLGLELLVAADIINTVAVTPTFQSIGVLAGIVLIRTFLSVSLEIEVSGRWPWQRDEGDNVVTRGV